MADAVAQPASLGAQREVAETCFDLLVRALLLLFIIIIIIFAFVSKMNTPAPPLLPAPERRARLEGGSLTDSSSSCSSLRARKNNTTKHGEVVRYLCEQDRRENHEAEDQAASSSRARATLLAVGYQVGQQLGEVYSRDRPRFVSCDHPAGLLPWPESSSPTART